MVITFVKNKESKKQLIRIYVPVKLVGGRISIKKREKFVLNLQCCQFE